MSRSRRLRGLEQATLVARVAEDTALAQLAAAWSESTRATDRARQLTEFSLEMRRREPSADPMPNAGLMAVAADFERTLVTAIQGASQEEERLRAALEPVTVHWQLRRQRRRSLSERCEQLRTEARLRGQRRQLDALLELVLVRPRTESAK